MNIRIALLALLTLSTLNANTCTSKQMGEMIKKGISSEDIDKICEINKTESKKDEVKKVKINKTEVKKDEMMNDNHLSKRELFIQYEDGSLRDNSYNFDFKGFSIGSTRKYKKHLFSYIYKPLSVEVKREGRTISSEMNTFKFKYGYGYKLSTKKNIIIQPEVVFTDMKIENDNEVYSLMAVLRADIEYTKGNFLNISYVLAGLRNIKTINSIFATYAEDTVPGMLTVETKNKLFNDLTINGLYTIYKNNTLENTTITTASVGVGVKYEIENIYIKAMFESITYSSSRPSAKDLDTDRGTFRVGYNF